MNRLVREDKVRYIGMSTVKQCAENLQALDQSPDPGAGGVFKPRLDLKIGRRYDSPTAART